MTASKFDKLIELYPDACKRPEPNYGYSWFGFECGEGWADLLDPILKYIDTHNKNQTDPDEMIYISQIKEKFGTLRFYTSFGNDELYEIIRKAEKLSAETCESCGKPGKLTGMSWYSTLCEEHTKNENL